MPGFRTRGKISEEQARALVAHVRAFAPAKKKLTQQEANEPADDFEQSFRRLQEQLEALQKQFRQLSESFSDGKPAPSAPVSSAPAAKKTSAAITFFRKEPLSQREISIGSSSRTLG